MSRRLDTAAPPVAWLAVLVAVGLVAWLGFHSGAVQGVGAAEQDEVFSPTVATWAQAIPPAHDSPYAAPWTPSSVAGRASITVALGRRTALRDFASVSSAATVVVFGLLLTTAGLPAFPVLLTMVAMAAGATFWARGTIWTPDALSPLLALCAQFAAWRWTRTRRAWPGIAAVPCAALALAEDPAWMPLVAAAAVFVWQRRSGTNRGLALGGLVTIGACAAIPFFTTAAIARGLSWAPGIEAPGAWASWAYASSALPSPSFDRLTTGLAPEFTPLGLVLVVIGVAVAGRSPGLRAPLGVLVAGLLIWRWVLPSNAPTTALVLCGWAAVATTLTWLQATVASHGRTLAVIAALLLVGEPALTRGRLDTLGANVAFLENAATALRFNAADLPEGAALVSETRRMDAMIRLSSQIAGHPASFAPQDGTALAGVAAAGRPVVAFSGGRDHLGRYGVLFERSWIGATGTFSVVGQVPCARLEAGRWDDVTLLVANGGFILHGATPHQAPGGIVMRLADPQPVQFAASDPRTIPYELGPTVHDGAVGISDLDRVIAGRGQWPLSTLAIRNTERPVPVTFRFQSAPVAAVATAADDHAVMLCPVPVAADPTLGSATMATSVPLLDGRFFGPGWHTPESDPDVFRWTAEPDALVRISVAPVSAVQVTITATPAARANGRPTLGLSVNHCALSAAAMPPGQNDYSWDVGRECLQPGANALWLHAVPTVSAASLGTGPDTRPLGARIGAIRIRRLP